MSEKQMFVNYVTPGSISPQVERLAWSFNTAARAEHEPDLYGEVTLQRVARAAAELYKATTGEKELPVLSQPEADFMRLQFFSVAADLQGRARRGGFLVPLETVLDARANTLRRLAEAEGLRFPQAQAAPG